MKYLLPTLALVSSMASANPLDRGLASCPDHTASNVLPTISMIRATPNGFLPNGRVSDTMIMEGMFSYRFQYNEQGTANRMRSLHDFVVLAVSPQGVATRTGHPYTLEHQVILQGAMGAGDIEPRFFAHGIRGNVASTLPFFYSWYRKIGTEIRFAVGTSSAWRINQGAVHRWVFELDIPPRGNMFSNQRRIVPNRVSSHFVLGRRADPATEFCPDGNCVNHCVTHDMIPRDYAAGVSFPGCYVATYGEPQHDRQSIANRYEVLLDEIDGQVIASPRMTLHGESNRFSVSRCINPIPGRNPTVVEK